MTQIESRLPDAAAQQQASVWDQPGRTALFNPATEGPRDVDAIGGAQVAANERRGDATQIDGDATNAGTREQTQSQTGQPLFAAA